MVPHGTFTMTKTAQVLEKALEQKMEEKSAKYLSPKAVVLVGSLVPLGEPSSDAFDNLAVALRWLQSHEAILIFDTKTSYIVIALKDGVRLVMSGNEQMIFTILTIGTFSKVL